MDRPLAMLDKIKTWWKQSQCSHGTFEVDFQDIDGKSRRVYKCLKCGKIELWK